MTQFLFKGPEEGSRHYIITAKNEKDALFDLTMYLMETDGIGDVSYWIDNPDKVSELK